MTNIFLENWKFIYKVLWRNYSQTLFWKIKIEHIPKSIVLSSIQILFIVCQVVSYWNILKLSWKPLCCKLHITNYLILLHFVILKNKKRSGTSLPLLIFCIVFEEKYFSGYILLIGQISLPGCLYFVRYWVIGLLTLFINQFVTS